ncbi:MAG: hypothetical protein WDN66_05165 [Candidatus Saccharibacteria bacterium]
MNLHVPAEGSPYVESLSVDLQPFQLKYAVGVFAVAEGRDALLDGIAEKISSENIKWDASDVDEIVSLPTEPFSVKV